MTYRHRFLAYFCLVWVWTEQRAVRYNVFDVIYTIGERERDEYTDGANY